MDINLSVIVPAITAIIVAILASVVPQLIVRWRSPEEEEKDRATAAGVISETSIRMVRRWEERVEKLEALVKGQAQQIKELEAKTEQQEHRIKELESEVDRLEREAHSLLIENNSLAAQAEVFKTAAAKLEEQIVDLGQLPVWQH